ncbi:hemerythrin domain-containing protein [Motiliproteus sp. MSK22-1]|uniref:hemerythrin domain-containing protein n=1 Tax=Motiliproteus sp. MSK22-1 TaxID=1897630 RepID=UPI000976E0B6|nr:hemerythrin domain-containing protein [Motiliproteus sp. MSK22-1]OMH29162.1 hypothetical protein BGP75_20685 [Motiliproteus sp. MSK22-1]
MKRIQQLQQLSKEHHHALVTASRCKASSNRDSDEQCANFWIKTLQFAKKDLAPHFKIEEEVLVPVLTRIGAKELKSQLLTEHQKLNEILSDQKTPPRVLLKHFGELLSGHVRFEERELFEVLQHQLRPTELEQLREAIDQRAHS